MHRLLQVNTCRWGCMPGGLCILHARRTWCWWLDCQPHAPCRCIRDDFYGGRDALLMSRIQEQTGQLDAKMQVGHAMNGSLASL